ncbi:MAG: lipoate--protein ligase family protein [Candidatus Freyarchaeota archaeon]
MVEKLRLLIDGVLEPSLGFAMDETIMLCVHKSLVPSTIHFWSCRPTLSVAVETLREEEIEELKQRGVEVVRRHTIGPSFYADEKSVIFSFILNTKKLDLPENITELYSTLYQPVVRAVRSYGVPCTYDGLFYLGRGWKPVSQSGQFWYYDVLVFQGVVYLETDVDVPNRLNLLPREVTCLQSLYQGSVPKEDFIRNTCLKIRAELGVELVRGDLTLEEEALLKRVLKSKYHSERWLLYGIPPLAYGNLLIEVLTANPPTEKCAETVENVKEAIKLSQEEDRIELRVWRSGEARPPGTFVSSGLVEAAKNSRIPAVTVNGILKFSRRAPSKTEVLESIREEIKKIR